MTRFQKGRQPRDLDGLDEVIVRVTTWVAFVFVLLLVVVGLISGDRSLLPQAVTPGVTGLVGGWMLLRRSPRVIVQLATSGLAIAITTGLFETGSRSGALFGLMSMGIVGGLMLKNHLAAYMIATSLALFSTAYWWNVGGWVERERVSEALVPAFAFLFAGGLVTWLKRQLVAEASRRKETSEALATSEEQFRMAFEMSAAGMMLVGVENGEFLRVNGACCEMLGYPHSDLLEMNMMQVLRPEDRQQAAARFAAVVAGETEHSQATVRYVRSDGSIAYGLVSAALVVDAEGDPRHIVAQVVDTSDQHAAEQRLTDLLAARDELIASVSHELRTPLTAVLGYAGILLESAPGAPPPDYEDMLGEIVDQGSDLVAIIEDLLVFAQTDAASLTVRPSTVDLKAQLALVLGALETVVPVERVNISGPSVGAIADPVRVRQVLRNLLSNAWRYGGDSVVVELSEVDSEVMVVVSDNGSGVPPQDRERIFEPYQRSRPKDGLTAAIGVGLTVARRLARLMGGELTYLYEDGWSRFELVLPMAAVTPSAQAEARSRPGSDRSDSVRPLDVTN